MDPEQDTFLVTVYCIVDDLYKERFAPLKPDRPGPDLEISDSEVLCLGVLAQWQHNRSETAFLEYAGRHLREYFPRWPHQSVLNRRMRDLCGVLCSLGPAVEQYAASLWDSPPAYEVLDAVPVPLLRRCRSNKQHLFGSEAARGVGGADKEWFYGVKLLVSVTEQGLISGFVEGPANTDERWLAEALLRWRADPAAPAPRLEDLAEELGPTHQPGGERLGPTGPISCYLGVGESRCGVYLGDLGYKGRIWARHWRECYQARVLTKADYNAEVDPVQRRKASHWLSSLRQEVETGFAWLTETFGVKYPRARSYWGLLTRLGAKIAAYNLQVVYNRMQGRPTFAQFFPL